MTDDRDEAGATRMARLYGAGELGVLSVTAPGDAHPRVEYLGGELFAGLTSGDGSAVTRGEAEAWSRPFSEAVAEAVNGVDALPEADGGVVHLPDDTQAVAALIDPSRLSTAGIDGAPVVFALSRTRVVIVGADDEPAIGRVLDLAEELYEDGGPLISIHPLALVDGSWQPFPWIERFPELAQRIHRTIRLFGVRAYEAQTAVLQRDDIHVADPKVHVREDGVTITFAAWPKGTATLLPVVDNVMIADPSGQISAATMNDFLDAAGDRIQRTNLSPARYFVPGDEPTTTA